MNRVQHPLSAAFPAMSPADFEALRDSISNIGVQNPITLLDGMVLDGWHRYTAATELGMTCPEVDLAPTNDPRDFVLAQNKARRHVTQAQLALATTAVYDWMPEGNPGFVQLDTECPVAKTTAELAQIAGVHPNTIKQAKAVQKRAAPEVIEAVKRGDVGLPKAAAISKLPQEQQASALTAPTPKVAPAAEAIEPSVSEGPQPDDIGPDAEELAALAAAEAADREALAKLLDSDDKLATAHAEITRLNHLTAQLQQRLNGLMNEKNEAVKQCKALQRQLDRARKGQAA
ncbi:MAG: hypothetical protein JZU58_20455 [Curvibacter lanceolatus]|uniref:hypothetical protein n=1 Tax=Curvibacter lanceolatus TaxID=86182 RepID=UPI0023573A1A|nr:hypothetical protein [Curvibacter lanceolatus]MBV5294720.1 hypothetical protein [Curvibacter lanceolatus]